MACSSQTHPSRGRGPRGRKAYHSREAPGRYKYMSPVTLPFAQMFTGPIAFLVVSLVALLVLLAVVRVLISIAWRVIAIGALLLIVLWLVGAVSLGPL